MKKIYSNIELESMATVVATLATGMRTVGTFMCSINEQQFIKHYLFYFHQTTRRNRWSNFILITLLC